MSNMQITVSAADARVTGAATLTSGMVGAKAAFVFSDAAWTPLRKIAVFRAGSVRRDVEESDWSGNVCTIPWECLAEPDERLLAGVYGMDSTGAVVIPTVYADCGWILPGADPGGDPAADPTSPFYTSLLEEALARAKASGVFDGEKGEKGDRGLRGEKGEKGDAGADGSSYMVLGQYATAEAMMAAHPTGKAGDAWFIGTADSGVVYQWDVDQHRWVNVGALKGAKGDPGERGEPGEKGERGEKGDKGDRGEKGDTGADGAPGVKGAKGEKGDPGDPGAAGKKGDKGDPGDRGLPGAAGKSAYTAALEGGYTGTETQFAAALAQVESKQAALTPGSNVRIVNNVIDTRVQPSRQNLLHNWYFPHPVNQRLVSGTFSTAGAYFLDRWKLVSGTVTIDSDGVTLNGTMAQVLEDPAGAAVTATVLTAAGISEVVPVYNDTTRTFSITAQNKKLLGAKLELGDAQTLAHQSGGAWQFNELPDPALELAKCQRFCFAPFVGGSIFSRTTFVGASMIQFFVPIPVTLRTNPVLESGTINVGAWGSTGLARDFTYTYTALRNSVRVLAAKTGHGLTDAWMDLNKVVFSADL